MSGIEDFYRGDTQRYKLTLTEKETGDPIDLTGGTMWFTLKSKASDTDADAVVQKQVTTHLDAVNGITEVVLDATDTTNADAGRYYYDFQFVDSAGTVKTILAGKVRLLQDITRSV